MSEPTVFIVDDDPSARRGLTRLVRAAGLNAESFASGTEFLASEHLTGPGCIVLDVQMPEMTGPELQEELARADYSMPIVFLSAHADVPITAGAMKKGAVDFLTKPVDGKDLLAAIEESLARDAENREQRAETLSIQKLIETLTPREHEVMTYVITGMLNKQIAEVDDSRSRRIVYQKAKGVALRIYHRQDPPCPRHAEARRDADSVAELVRLCEKAGIPPEPGLPTSSQYHPLPATGRWPLATGH